MHAVERERLFPLGAAVTLEALEHDPHPVLAFLRRREPVSWVPVLGGWIVTRWDLALEVMRQPADFTVDDVRFSTAQVIGPSMLSLDGAEHARHRAPFARPFRLDAVRERFTAVVGGEVDHLIDAIEPHGRAELRSRLAAPLAASVMVTALGLEGTTPEVALGWYDAIVSAVTDITASRSSGDAGREGFARLCAGMGSALDRDPSASLVSAAASEAGGLTRAQVESNAAVLLFGGIETTEGMIANLLLHLLQNDADRAQIQQDPALLANAIEESLRLEPAAAVVDRYATRDVRLGTADVRRRDPVIVSIAGANRDPAVFEEPDRFDPRRPNANRHLTFAQGPHVCLGMHLARLEAQTAALRALQRLPGLRLDSSYASYVGGLVFRKPAALHAVWDS